MPFRRPKLWKSRQQGDPLTAPAIMGAAAGGLCAAFGLDWKKRLGVVTAAYVVLKIASAGDE